MLRVKKLAYLRDSLLFQDFHVLLPASPLKPSCRRSQGIDKDQAVHSFYKNNGQGEITLTGLTLVKYPNIVSNNS